MLNLFILISCSLSLSLGKTSSWEDDSWGAWEETEPREPVSVYNSMFCLYSCVRVGYMWRSEESVLSSSHP
jgi:hypothetical protein